MLSCNAIGCGGVGTAEILDGHQIYQDAAFRGVDQRIDLMHCAFEHNYATELLISTSECHLCTYIS